MIDRTTLVIPTFNRPAFLERLVRFYHKRARPLNLLVLDSSKPEVTEENAKALSQYGSAVRHVIFPGAVPGSSKLSQGLALVQTVYASFCADDDLVFPEELARSVAFLAQHSDYVSAHGLYLNFRQTGNDVQLFGQYSGPSNEAIHPGARIFRLLQRYESLFYGAFRTGDLRDIFMAIEALPTPHFQELFQSVATLIKGKVKRFPSFYAARQSGPPAEPERVKWQTYHWFADNPVEILEHYRPYCEAIWKFYETHISEARLERSAFFKTLDLAHAVYFSSGCPPEYFHAELQKYWPGDRYLRYGRLEMLREADKPSVLNWAGFPGDDPAADLIDKLRTPSGLGRWAAVRALAALWYFAYSVPGLARLNYDARKVGHTAWKCRLSPRFLWLAAVPEFRNAWIELCYYLDQT